MLPVLPVANPFCGRDEATLNNSVLISEQIIDVSFRCKTTLDYFVVLRLIYSPSIILSTGLAEGDVYKRQPGDCVPSLSQ